jgi:hypothetical protein
MKRALVSIVLIVLFSASVAHAAVIDVNGGHVFLVDLPGQTFDIMVSGDGVEVIRTLDFRASISGGSGAPFPMITSVTFGDAGLFFEGAPFINDYTGPATTDVAGAVGAAIFTDKVVPTEAVPIARVTIDTTGAGEGTWNFLLSSSAGDTVISPPNPPVAPTLLNGTITAIPEPAVVVQLLGLAGIGGVGFWFRRRTNRAGK